MFSLTFLILAARPEKLSDLPERLEMWSQDILSKQITKKMMGNRTLLTFIFRRKIRGNRLVGPVVSMAARIDFLELVKYLVTLGYSIHEGKDDYDEAIFYAIRNRNLKMIKYLVKKGIDIHVLDGADINFSVEKDYSKVFEYLKTIGFKIDYDGFDGFDNSHVNYCFTKNWNNHS